MTQSATPNFYRYPGPGGTSFSFPYGLQRKSDLVVTKTDLTTGLLEAAPLVEDTDYTIALSGVGAVVTLLQDLGDFGLELRRELPLDQDLVLDNNGTVLVKDIERRFDRVVQIAQQLKAELNRAFKVALGDTTTDPTLPAAQEGYVLGWVGGVLRNLSAATAQLAADLLSSAVGKGASLITYLAPYTGTVARTQQSKNEDTIDMRDLGLVVDGLTDQTSALVSKLTALGSAGFRGWIKIPYNTKFTVATVYAAVPTGVILEDESSINWGQPPTYKNKFRIMYSGDLVADDTQQIIGSGHHPALMLLNMGTAGSGAAASRYATLLHGVGKDAAGDPLLGWITQYAKAPSSNKWRISHRLETPYLVAMGNPSAWTTGQVVAAGSYRTSDGGKVYKTTAGGTCGVTAPTGTGTAINDGAVLWDYVQAAIAIDSTRWDMDEDANTGQYGPAASDVTHTIQSGSRSFTFGVNGTTNDVFWRDVSRGLDVIRVSDTKGAQFGVAQSVNRLAVTGANPNAPVTGAGKVTQGGATTLATMVKPTGVTSMIVTLRFDDANTTINQNAVTNGFLLKGGVTTGAIPAGSFMQFELDTAMTSAWREMSRSF